MYSGVHIGKPILRIGQRLMPYLSTIGICENVRKGERETRMKRRKSRTLERERWSQHPIAPHSPHRI